MIQNYRTFDFMPLPAFAYTPTSFFPLHTANMLIIEGRMAWAPLAVPLRGAILALFLALSREKDHFSLI